MVQMVTIQHFIALSKNFFRNVLFIQRRVFNFVIDLTTYGQGLNNSKNIFGF